MESLIDLLNEKISKIEEEQTNINKKLETINIKINLYNKLNNNYHNITICKDEEIYKLIESKEINITLDDYKSMKLVIEHEELLGSNMPQIIIAKEQCETLIRNLYVNEEEIKKYKEEQSSIQAELEKYKNIINIINNQSPILEIDFIVNIISTSNINIELKNKLLTELIIYNKAIYKKIDAEKQQEKTHEQEIPTPVESTLQETEEETKPQEEYNYEIIEEPEEIITYDEELEIIKSASNIIKNQQNIVSSLKGREESRYYWEHINNIINKMNNKILDLQGCIDLLKESPNDEELKQEKDIIKQELISIIEEYDEKIIPLLPQEEINTSKKQYEDENAKNIIVFFRKDESSKFMIEEDLEKNNATPLDYFNIEKILKIFNNTDTWMFLQKSLNRFCEKMRESSEKDAKPYIFKSKYSGKNCQFSRAKNPILKKGMPSLTRVSFLKLHLCDENKEKLGLKNNTIILVLDQINISNYNTHSGYGFFIRQLEANKERIQQVIELFENPNTNVEILYRLLNDSSDLYYNLRSKGRTLG